MNDLTEQLTEQEMETLRHMLGVSDRVRKEEWGYRNHYCVEIDNIPADLISLENRRLVFRGRTINDGQDVYFHATEEAKTLVGVVSE